MHSTKKAIAERLPEIDVVIELLDARLAGTYTAPNGTGPSNFGLDAGDRPPGNSLMHLLMMPFSRPAKYTLEN